MKMVLKQIIATWEMAVKDRVCVQRTSESEQSESSSGEEG